MIDRRVNQPWLEAKELIDGCQSGRDRVVDAPTNAANRRGGQRCLTGGGDGIKELTRQLGVADVPAVRRAVPGGGGGSLNIKPPPSFQSCRCRRLCLWQEVIILLPELPLQTALFVAGSRGASL